MLWGPRICLVCIWPQLQRLRLNRNTIHYEGRLTSSLPNYSDCGFPFYWFSGCVVPHLMLLTVIVRHTHAGCPPLVKSEQGICWPFNRHQAGTKLNTFKDQRQGLFISFSFLQKHISFLTTVIPNILIRSERWSSTAASYIQSQASQLRSDHILWRMKVEHFTTLTKRQLHNRHRTFPGHVLDNCRDCCRCMSRCGLMVIGSCGEVSRWHLSYGVDPAFNLLAHHLSSPDSAHFLSQTLN